MFSFAGAKRASIFVVVTAVLLPGAHAQVPGINPGAIDSEIQRQRERTERQLQPPRQQGPGVVGPARQPAGAIRPGGPKFVLRAVAFDESKFLSKEELDGIIAPYIGRPVDFSDLQKILQAINDLYAKKGVVTGIATLPPQKADKGIVKIKLTEGKLGRVSMEGNVQTSRDYIMSRVNLGKPGETLDVPRVSREVTWFNKTNDVQIRTLLQPGSTFGLTDVQMAVTDPAINTWQVFFDNQGVQSTGRYQGGTYYRRHGMLGIDDRLTFYGTGSHGNLNGNVSYNIPFNPLGGRLGVSYTRGKIKIVDGPTEPLDVTGNSEQASVNVAQPFYIDDSWIALLNLAHTYGKSVSKFSDTTIVDDRSQKETAGFSITHSGAEHAISIAPAANYVKSHSEVLNRDRYFYLFTGTVSALFKLPSDFSVSMLGSYQYTWEKLLPGDQLFTIGGPTTVRGYPTSVASGDSGYYANAELHRAMPSPFYALDVFMFYDRGETYSTFPAVRLLNSAGAGMSLSVAPALTYEIAYAHPLTEIIADQQKHQFYGRVTFRPLLFK